METKFLARVAELTNMNVNELAAMPYRQVINSVVLPQILYPTGQDTRGWRIGEKLHESHGRIWHKMLAS